MASKEELAQQQRAQQEQAQREAQQREAQQQQAPPPAQSQAQAQAQQAEGQQDSGEDTTVKSPLQPFPEFEQLDLDALRSAAQEKGVGIPADVEKAELIGLLRQSESRLGPASAEGPHDVAKQGEARGEVEVGSPQSPFPSYDLMTVEELRSLAEERGVSIDEDTERGYLVGQLRAVASGPTAAQSAQVGSARPGESLPAPSGVQDKDRGRS